MKVRELSPFVDLLGPSNPRKLFVRALNDVAQSVISDLENTAFGFYMNNRAALEGDPGRLTAAKLNANFELDDALDAWAKRHHLTHRQHIADWIFACAKGTLEHWAANGCTAKLLSPTATESPIDLTAELRNLTEVALARVLVRLTPAMDDLVAGGTEGVYAETAGRICEEEVRKGFSTFRSELEQATGEIEAILSKADPRMFTPEDEVRLEFEPMLHARWAVRYQVLEQPFEAIEGNTREPSVMRKIVRVFLSTIGLTPRRSHGRPPKRIPQK